VCHQAVTLLQLSVSMILGGMGGLGAATEERGGSGEVTQLLPPGLLCLSQVPGSEQVFPGRF
jgi:hypothetical protein